MMNSVLAFFFIFHFDPKNFSICLIINLKYDFIKFLLLFVNGTPHLDIIFPLSKLTERKKKILFFKKKN